LQVGCDLGLAPSTLRWGCSANAGLGTP